MRNSTVREISDAGKIAAAARNYTGEAARFHWNAVAEAFAPASLIRLKPTTEGKVPARLSRGSRPRAVSTRARASMPDAAGATTQTRRMSDELKPHRRYASCD